MTIPSIVPIAPMNVGAINDLLKTQQSASASQTNALGTAGGANAAPVGQLGKTFSDMLAQLTQSENQTNGLVEQMSAGGNVDLHDLTISMQETDVQFRVAMAIRDQLVNAYREAMRMQV